MTGDRQARRRGRGKSLGRRRRAREMAVQMLYQLEVGKASQEEVFAHFDLGDDGHEAAAAGIEAAAGSDRGSSPHRPDLVSAFAYAQTLVSGVLEHNDEIDQRIRFHAENWRLERMPLIDRNILRVAIFEMLHASDVPKVVIVDEAIELAKRFGAENSSRFVNGLLDGVLKASRAKATDEFAESASGG